MTKKLSALFLAFVLVLSFASCGSSAPTETNSDTVKETLTNEDIEKVKEFAKSYILDFEGINVEVTGYRILHDMETELPNAVDVTFVSDELWTLGSETHEVNGFIIVELYGGVHENGYNVTLSSMCNPSYYANVKDEWKLYFIPPMGTYYKKEGSDTYYHTIASSQNIVPGEYKDPTLSS